MNHRKKICIVVSSPYTSMFLLNHVKELSKDFDIYLVANFDEESKKVLSYFNFKGHKNIDLNRDISIIKDISAVYNLCKYFKTMDFDATHSITPKAGLVSNLAGRLAGIKHRIHIFTGQVWATKKGSFRYILKLIDKITASLATDILVDGKPQRDFLISENVIPPGKAKVLGEGSISGVDLKRFHPDQDVRAELRKELNLSDDTLVYLFLGRLTIDKGVIELAHAYNRLISGNKNTYMLFVGRDEENLSDKINNIISDKSKFKLVGSTGTPERYFQASDIYCLPSHREGFGSSVIEASASQLPVICSDTYGLMDTMKHNQTGLRHKVKDYESIHAHLKTLLEDASLRDQLGRNGLKYVTENFSSDLITDQWVIFYKNLLNKS